MSDKAIDELKAAASNALDDLLELTIDDIEEVGEVEVKRRIVDLYTALSNAGVDVSIHQLHIKEIQAELAEEE